MLGGDTVQISFRAYRVLHEVFRKEFSMKFHLGEVDRRKLLDEKREVRLKGVR